MRRKIARKLRNLADRVDPSSGLRGIGAYFNIVPGRGLVITQTDGVRVNPPVPGVPLWYMAEDYDRAWEFLPAPRDVSDLCGQVLDSMLYGNVFIEIPRGGIAPRP